MSRYTKTPYTIGQGSMVLSPDRMAPHPVGVKPDLPGAVIVIHGVNDVGTSFEAVEQGLCEGLSNRLGWQGGKAPYVGACYNNYDPAKDADRLESDPDAVFFKRKIAGDTYSSVIPFYWGYRADQVSQHNTVNGQKVDRFGNRLDKDLSKGGGPFANATSTLADMWNSGAPRLMGLPDKLAADPLRPVLEAPGRMYMILAAKRLAALIAMIRDYDPNEAVSVVAHSQGCLMETPGGRPADTLILTHPPYSLEETLVESMGLCHGGGEDEAMKGQYQRLGGQQTLKARMDTLINIVTGVAKGQKSGWSADELQRMRQNGVHTAKWEATQDRDNRGKVYLYFCPEDMTVALPNVQGIGWQGVPYKIKGSKVPEPGDQNPSRSSPIMTATRQPLKELGERFLQRVFTAKVRPSKDGQRGAFKVGLAPQDFVLREQGENDHDHVTKEGASHRADLPETDRDGKHWYGTSLSDDDKQKGLRYISGEALTAPTDAEMYAGSLPNTKPKGAFESVDAIDAAIAVTSQYGLNTLPPYEIDDPYPDNPWHKNALYAEMYPDQIKEVEASLNEDKPEGDRIKIVRGTYSGTGKLTIERKETPNEARLRHQHGTSGRSFHGAIIGGRRNHANVTAYDVTVGQGLAVSHPDFYRYLCAVADWRLKKPPKNEKARPGILEWSKFQEVFALYWSEEDAERKKIIEGNCDYYSKGKLPQLLPDITRRPKAVACETTLGRRTDANGDPQQTSAKALTEDERAELGEWANVRVANKSEQTGNIEGKAEANA